MKKEDLVKIGEMESFFKEAMCIDGECKFYKFIKIEIDGNNRSYMLFELNDSKKGKWYLSMTR